MDTEKAKQFGKNAFIKGKDRVPALDGQVLALLKGTAIGESVPVLKAWLDGWDNENLASAYLRGN